MENIINKLKGNNINEEEAELIYNYIKELELNINHLIDLQKNMDKQYEKLEERYYLIKDEYQLLVKNLKCDNCVKGGYDETIYF